MTLSRGNARFRCAAISDRYGQGKPRFSKLPMQYQQAAQSRADFAAHVSIACRRDYADIPVAEG
jgi:hypothetical protein